MFNPLSSLIEIENQWNEKFLFKKRELEWGWELALNYLLREVA